MACGTHNLWTKIISWFTIIFCLAYVGIEIAILIIYHTEYNNHRTVEYFRQINKYCSNNDVKTLILLYSSLVFNTLWTITSVLLLIFLRKNETNDYSMKETQKLIKVYFSWIILGFLSFIPDVVGMIMHGIAIKEDKNDTEHLKKDGALYMLIISSRFIVVLVYNICSWIGMIIITSSLQKSLVEDDTKSGNKRIVPLKPPKPALKPSKVPHLEENNVDRVRDWYKHYEEDKKNSENNSNNYYSEPDVVPQYIPRLNGNTNPAFVGNQNYRPVYKPPPPPPPQQSNPIPGSHTNVLVNGVPSGTLRRQLPWSYMGGSGEVPQLPSKSRGLSPAASNASAFTAQYPPFVPAPDYNDKPMKTHRQELGHPGWSQYL